MNHSDNIDELEAKLARQNAEFAEIKADIAKDIAYLVENFDLLTNKWGDYYFEKYSKEYPDRLKFADIFRSDIQWYIDYLSKKHTWDRWQLYDKAHWIGQKYKELLSDDGKNNPKQEALIEQVGVRGKVLTFLDRIRGK